MAYTENPCLGCKRSGLGQVPPPEPEAPAPEPEPRPAGFGMVEAAIAAGLYAILAGAWRRK